MRRVCDGLQRTKHRKVVSRTDQTPYLPKLQITQNTGSSLGGGARIKPHWRRRLFRQRTHTSTRATSHQHMKQQQTRPAPQPSATQGKALLHPNICHGMPCPSPSTPSLLKLRHQAVLQTNVDKCAGAVVPQGEAIGRFPPDPLLPLHKTIPTQSSHY